MAYASHKQSAAAGAIVVVGTIVKPGHYANKAARQEIRILRKWFKALSYKRYPVDVTLIIGQDEYEAMLRFAPSDKTAWMPAHLNKKKVRLVDALKLGGFVRGQVKLRVAGTRIEIVNQLTVARRCVGGCTTPATAPL